MRAAVDEESLGLSQAQGALEQQDAAAVTKRGLVQQHSASPL